MTFQATADGKHVTLIPVARAQHQHYTVYWNTTPARQPGRPGTGGHYPPWVNHAPKYVRFLYSGWRP